MLGALWGGGCEGNEWPMSAGVSAVVQLLLLNAIIHTVLPTYRGWYHKIYKATAPPVQSNVCTTRYG